MGGDWIPEYVDRLAGVTIRTDCSRPKGEVLGKLAHTRLRMHKKPFQSQWAFSILSLLLSF